jgi:hypothetical protein
MKELAQPWIWLTIAIPLFFGALKVIFTGSRCTTFTQLPVAFSGGRSEKAAPVPALRLSTLPR